LLEAMNKSALKKLRGKVRERKLEKKVEVF
jgi:hypothetical protein